MVAYLNKSDASEGFNQVIDFLNGSYIKYALTVNLTIYVTCVKQFWNTIVVKQSNDVTRLQALVDRKKVVITEVAIRDVLRLDDADGVDCLANEDIFAELAHMGYEKPSAMASAVICLSTVRKFNFSKYIFESLVRNVDNSSKFYMYPRFIQLIIHNQLGGLSTHTTKYTSPALTQKVFANMRRVGKGFLGVKTPLLEGMLVVREIEEQGDAEEQDNKAEDAQVGGDEQVKGRQAEIYQIDMDHASKVLSMQEDEPEVQEVVEVVTTTKLITEVVATVSESVTAVSATIAVVPTATITAAPVRVAAASTRGRRKRVVIRDPKEESTTVIPAEIKSKDKGKRIMDVAIDHVKQKAKEDSYVQRYQVMKKRPQTEAQARRNMIMYLKNVAGFRLDYFKRMSYDDIRPIFEAKFNLNIEFLLKSKEEIEEEENRAIESINETPAQKAAKRRKMNEEVEDLKQHLEIVPDEDDDVYTQATPLTRKVPVVDYQIIQLNNKPHYKIIRADGTHQLYGSRR
nr:hypothetical protein [Tanacetum cinerariifolium]